MFLSCLYTMTKISYSAEISRTSNFLNSEIGPTQNNSQAWYFAPSTFPFSDLTTCPPHLLASQPSAPAFDDLLSDDSIDEDAILDISSSEENNYSDDSEDSSLDLPILDLFQDTPLNYFKSPQISGVSSQQSATKKQQTHRDSSASLSYQDFAEQFPSAPTHQPIIKSPSIPDEECLDMSFLQSDIKKEMVSAPPPPKRTDKKQKYTSPQSLTSSLGDSILISREDYDKLCLLAKQGECALQHGEKLDTILVNLDDQKHNQNKIIQQNEETLAHVHILSKDVHKIVNKYTGVCETLINPTISVITKGVILVEALVKLGTTTRLTMLVFKMTNVLTTTLPQITYLSPGIPWTIAGYAGLYLLKTLG